MNNLGTSTYAIQKIRKDKRQENIVAHDLDLGDQCPSLIEKLDKIEQKVNEVYELIKLQLIMESIPCIPSDIAKIIREY